jgi:hypothetical protein
MRPLTGRKAMVLISSGIDTFSKASYDDLLRTAENSASPIYVVSPAPVLSHLSKWNTQLRSRELTGARRKTQLQEIARASGGRAYAPENMIDQLVNPSNGEPLEIVDSNGKTISTQGGCSGKLQPQDCLRRVSLFGGPFSVTKGR